jgi:hypothetical protein
MKEANNAYSILIRKPYYELRQRVRYVTIILKWYVIGLGLSGIG